uniref:Phytosulfokine n=1 Tax=Aegilops tauschii subsp. strangulata TaxID=200361 RepID=A0A453KA16_AEGTS
FAGIGVAGAKAADAAATDGLVALKEEGGKARNGGEAVSPPEATAEGVTAGEMEVEVEEEACEEGKEGEECMQRRLLHDAHLDYIYTQHKGRP